MAFVSIHGYIGRDPELRTAGSSQVLNFAVADKGFIPSKDGEPAAPQWYQIEVWGPQAQTLSNLLHSGSEVVCSGQLIQRSYTNKDGVVVQQQLVKTPQVSLAGLAPSRGGGGSFNKPAADRAVKRRTVTGTPYSTGSAPAPVDDLETAEIPF